VPVRDEPGTGQDHERQRIHRSSLGHGDQALVTIVAGKIRMLTRADVTVRDIDTALDAWRRVTAAFGVPSPASAR
jgi:hypothetical protein